MNTAKTLLLLASLICCFGCASSVSDTTYPVAITSNPSGKTFVVKDESGRAILSGKTPETVMLKSGKGFFDGADYQVEFDSGKVLMISSSFDPWCCFGNILFAFGGLIGIQAADSASGGMWKLPETIDAGNLEGK